MPSQQRRYFRLRYGEYLRSFNLGESSLVDNRRDSEDQVGFCLKNVGIRQTEIAKNIAAASSHRFHEPFLLLGSGLVVLLCELESLLDQVDVALRGLDAFFDFFWNACRT